MERGGREGGKEVTERREEEWRGEGKKVEPRQGPLLLRPQWTWVGL